MVARRVEQEVGHIMVVHARLVARHVAEIERLERMIEELHGYELMRCSGPCKRVMDLLAV